MASGPTLASALTERLREDILARRLGEGDLFMTEGQVCDTYGVSRNIAREAVSRLRALGILDSRQARGLLVTRSSPLELMALSLPFSGDGPVHRQRLGQFRCALEVGAIDLAVANATEPQIDRLAGLAEDFARAVESGTVDEENQVESRFHGLLLEMTANPLLAGMHHLVNDYFRQLGTDRDSAPRRPPRGAAAEVWQHRAIVEAIRQRDVEQARALVRQHLQSLVQDSDADDDSAMG